MTTIEQIQLLLRLSGLTQSALAKRLGVSFPALNAWIRGRAKPRQAAQRRIGRLLAEYGVPTVAESVLTALKAELGRRAVSRVNVIRKILNRPDIRDEVMLALTYHSNVIEGSTLTKDETAAVLFDDAVLKNRTLREQMEARNHQAAVEYLWRDLAEIELISESLVLKLHGILMNGIQSDAGSYRRHGVRIVGANVPTANAASLPRLMASLMLECNRKKPDVMQLAAQVHARFEQIHPFSDGNGRVGRLLLNAMVLRANLAPAVIEQRRKREYMQLLNRAQVHSDMLPFEQFVAEAVLVGYAIIDRKRGT